VSFEIFECDGHSTSCSENPGCTAWACCTTTRQTRSVSGRAGARPYNEPRIVKDRRHEAPELATTESADTGGQRAREAAPAQVERVADTAHADDAEGAVKAAHGEAAHAADTVHGDDAEGAVEVVHNGAPAPRGTAGQDPATSSRSTGPIP
jgi:hypothetical protein